jgi:hypothetical protein
MFEKCGQPYGDRHCQATMQHTVTFFLSFHYKSPASVCHAGYHCSMHCLLSHSIPDNTQGLVPYDTKKMRASLFLLWTETWTCFWQGMLCVSNLYFVTSNNVILKGVTFMIPGQKAITDVQWLYLYCSMGCFWTHPAKLHGSYVCHETYHGQNHDQSADALPLYWVTFLLSRISASFCSMFPSVNDVGIHTNCSSVALAWPLLIASILSYTLHYGKTL